MFNPGINKGEIIDNQKLCNIFGCSPQGGMRRSHLTNSLVLVSNRIKSIYGDSWNGNVLNYTGMGQVGDQTLSSNQNKTLYESNKTGVRIFLFEVFEEKKYFFQGEFKLVEEPYQSKQIDINNTLRKVWIFPIQPIDSKDIISVPESLLLKKTKTRQEQVSKLSNDELLKKISMIPSKLRCRQSISNQFERNEYISEYSRRKANGKCLLCKSNAPFKNKNGEPYLEIHHIKWLANGGKDNLENTVALCPNCHKKMHILNLDVDVKALLALKIERN